MKLGEQLKKFFERDINQLEDCDLLIAEVSERSHGVGIEIGLSFHLKLKRILLIEKGNFVTKMAQGMPNTKVIEYENINDLKEKLKIELKSHKNL